jgi:hypothetical protein
VFVSRSGGADVLFLRRSAPQGVLARRCGRGGGRRDTDSGRRAGVASGNGTSRDRRGRGRSRSRQMRRPADEGTSGDTDEARCVGGSCDRAVLPRRCAARVGSRPSTVNTTITAGASRTRPLRPCAGLLPPARSGAPDARRQLAVPPPHTVACAVVRKETESATSAPRDFSSAATTRVARRFRTRGRRDR